MLTIRNTINVPLDIDFGPSFGVKRVPAMGNLTLDGTRGQLFVSETTQRRLKSGTLVITEHSGDPKEGSGRFAAPVWSAAAPTPRPDTPSPPAGGTTDGDEPSAATAPALAATPAPVASPPSVEPVAATTSASKPAAKKKG